MNKEILKGSIDILVLSIIAKCPTYGYEIIQQLKKNSDDLYVMSEGTLYPALRRLEEKGSLRSYWGDSELGGRRKYYEITNQGKQTLTNKLMEWNTIDNLIRTSVGGFA